MEKTENFKKFIKKNIGFIATFLTLIVYIFTSIFTITETGKTALQVIGDSALFFGVSMFVCSLLLWQGLLEGEDDERVLATNYSFSCTVEAMSPYVHLVSEWCELKNKERLARERKIILASGGLLYNDYFDQNGNLIKQYTPNFEDLKSKDKHVRHIEQKKINAYEKALNPEIEKLDQQTLMGGAKSGQRVHKKPLTKGSYTASALSKKAFSGVAFAVVFGVYTFKVRECFSWEAFVWYSLQACICFGSGILQLIQSRMFIIDDLRSQTIEHITDLDECRSDIRNKPEMFTEKILSIPPEKIERNYNKAKEKYLKEQLNDVEQYEEKDAT